jgi:hypothetical protein
VRVHAPASDDAFCVEPGGERVIRLHGEPPTAITALNLSGSVPVG